MKKTTFLTTLIVIGLISTLWAKEVDFLTAEKVASKYFYEVNANSADNNIDVTIKESFSILQEGEIVYYAFNFNGKGFVIVSADDARNPIIGYSKTNSYTNVNQSENYKSYMSGFANEILFLRENDAKPTAEIAARWNHLTESISKSVKQRSVIVDALCPAEWNQDNPYNYYCPIDEDGPGDRVYAGCVATAISMIMYYWRWPFDGEGSSSYYASGYGTLSADYENADYDPHGMINKPSHTLCDPLSMLMYHCGVSVEMGYSPDGSGASSQDIPQAIKTHFKYGITASYKQKASYTHANWINLLKTQLDDKYVIYYRGTEPPSGGHAFVCDGYDEDDYFHYNFGWGGSSNGFYDLSDVGGYYQGQAAITGIKPDESLGYPYYCYGNKTFNYLQGTIGDGSGPIEDYNENANATWLIAPEDENAVDAIEILFHRFDLAAGDYLRVYDGETTSAELLGEFTGNNIPEAVTSSGDKVLVQFTSDGAGCANGFVLEWEASTPDFCTGLTTYTEDEGTFTDGSGEYKYANGTTCMYQIMPDWATGITLTFEDFDTDPLDKVRIYDGSTLLDEISGTYSTSNLPGPYTSTEGSFLLQFNANNYVNAQGFTVHYVADNVGVEDIPRISDVKVTPNPANNLMTISFKSNKAQNINIALFSSTGQLILKENHTDISGNYDNTIDVSNFAKGVYFLRVESGNTVRNQKVIIK